MSRDSFHTDREILQCVFDIYRASYLGDRGETGKLENSVYLSIDLAEVATRLNTDSHLLFGRLYYSMDKKHRYTQDDGRKVHLFAPVVGSERNCVNFPYLTAILAEQRQENWKYRLTLTLSIAAVILSIIGLVIKR